MENKKMGKKELLDRINFWCDHLDELKKIKGAVKEMGVMDDEYARILLSVQVNTRIDDLLSATFMVEKYVEDLNQLEEGAVDQDDTDELDALDELEEDLPFVTPEEKEDE